MDNIVLGFQDPTSATVLHLCEHCDGEIYEGEEIALCGDGAIVHEDCLRDYAVQQLGPITKKIEEAV